MGSNESIVYGTGHGNEHETVEQADHAIERDGKQFVRHYPNGVLVRSYPQLGGGVAVGVQRYDEFGNPIGGTEINELIGSLWADLDRDGCNRLIAALRKHRERAYGKDQ